MLNVPWSGNYRFYLVMNVISPDNELQKRDKQQYKEGKLWMVLH